MKDYFINLLHYDRHSNLQILAVISQNGGSGRAVEVMAHVLAVQQIWLNRCKGLPNANSGTPWPNWTTDTFEATINSNHADWIDFLNTADLNSVINYKNFRGDSWSNQLTDICTHVINHGTHHRGQIGQLLKFAGAEKLPITDYIAFARI